MARPVTATSVADSPPAAVLLQRLLAAGFELAVEADRLRIRPAARVTPELRAALAARKPELLTLLRPMHDFVTLRQGPTLPLPALRLVWDLEARGFSLWLDADGQPVVEPVDALTERDRAALDRWRQHVAAMVGYVDEVIG